MPKLVITITEITKPIPGEPTAVLRGYDTQIKPEFEKGEDQSKSLLLALGPLFDVAISTVLRAAIGQPFHEAHGTGDAPSLEKTIDDATAKAQAICAEASISQFPTEL